MHSSGVMGDKKLLTFTFVQQLLRSVAVGAKKAVGQVLFRLLQFVVGFPFTVLICIQIGVAWLIRCLKQPASARKVQYWQQKQAAGALSSASASASTSREPQEAETLPETEDGTNSPIHVFPDSAEGEHQLGTTPNSHAAHTVSIRQMQEIFKETHMTWSHSAR